MKNKEQLLLQKYSPIWAINFLQLRKIIDQTLVNLAVTMEHIGSTAVEGLAAKPIIDIDIVYTDATSFTMIRDRLTQIDYFHAGDQGISGREVFKRNNHFHPVLDQITHHLYVCRFDNEELRRHLLFRDVLRTDEMVRQEYESLKYEIAKLAHQDRKKYAVLKEKMAKTFIENILHKVDFQK